MASSSAARSGRAGASPRAEPDARLDDRAGVYAGVSSSGGSPACFRTRSMLRSTSMDIARSSPISRRSGAARNVSDRTVRMIIALFRVLKKSMAASARSASRKYCSYSAEADGGASFFAGASGRVASAARRCIS
jgi:hypothetical protein